MSYTNIINSKEKGIALITVMLMLIVLTVLSITMFNTSTVESLISHNYRTSKEAFYAADAGIQDAINRLINDDASVVILQNKNDKTNEIVSPGFSTDPRNKFTIELTHVSGGNPKEYKVISKGWAGPVNRQAERIVEAQITPNYVQPFDNAMTGCEGVELIGNAVVDSYNSSQGPYAVSKTENGTVTTTNIDSDIDITGNAKIKGDALAVGDVNHPANSVTGKVGKKDYELCDPLDISNYVVNNDPFPNDSANNDIKASQTLGDDDFPLKISEIDLKGNSTLTIEPDLGDVTMFIEDDLSIGGNAKMEIGAGTYLTIYLMGDLDSTGNGILNLNTDPSSLKIFASKDSSGDGIKVGGNGSFVGSIYAPLTNVKIHGNGVFYGALRGKTVKNNGNPDFHFDEALKDITIGGPIAYKLFSWREIYN
jgi:hypothetical protein